MLRRYLIYSILLFFSFKICDSSATVIVLGKIKDDIEGSHYILTATIYNKEYQKDLDGEIITILHLYDIDIIKGKKEEVPQEIIYRGGIFQGVKRQIVGMPDYEVGNKYVLFLRYDNLTCPIIGLGYRSFPVKTNLASKKQHVLSHKDEIIDGIKGGDLSLSPRSVEKMNESGDNQSISYTDFRLMIENIMKQPDYQDKSLHINKIFRTKAK